MANAWPQLWTHHICNLSAMVVGAAHPPQYSRWNRACTPTQSTTPQPLHRRTWSPSAMGNFPDSPKEKNVSVLHARQPIDCTRAIALKHTRTSIRLTSALLASLATTCFAADKPNPSDCATQTRSKAEAAKDSCTALWCEYYACTAKQHHLRCKVSARAAIQACTAAEDPSFKILPPTRNWAFEPL